MKGDLSHLTDHKILKDKVAKNLRLPKLSNLLGHWKHGPARPIRGTKLQLSTVDIKHCCPGTKDPEFL